MLKWILIALILILLVLVGASGYLFFKLNTSTVYVAPEPIPTAEVPSGEGTSADISNESAASPDAPTPSATVPTGGFTIDIATLPESQQAILETLGFSDTITFTEEMVSCAEEKLGAARVEEFIGGAAPSVLEATKLVPCL